MSIRILSNVWKYSRATGADLLVMLALADFSNDQGESYPSLKIIAEKARLSVRAICKILERLEATGEIRRDRCKGGKNCRTRYFIQLLNSEQGSENGIQRTAYSEPGDTQTVNGGSHAINRHRTVKNSVRTKRAHKPDTDPRIKTVLTAFGEKFQAAAGCAPVITGKDAVSLKRLLSAGYDVPAILSAMDRYFSERFYRDIGFDAAGFAKAFNRLNSAGAKKPHNYNDGGFPNL